MTWDDGDDHYVADYDDDNYDDIHPNTFLISIECLIF